MIEISIIIPIRNQKDSLMAALNSFRRQIRHSRAFEIIICDDGSTDGVGDIIKRMRFPIYFKYFANNPPLGRAANRNLGVERSSGQHLIFIDGDMLPAPGFVDAILSDIGPEIVRLGDVKPPPEEKLDSFEKYLYSRGRYSQGFDTTNVPARMFTSNNFYIHRQLFYKVGGFDPAFRGWGGEDIDFGLRLEALNIPIKLAQEAITFHYHKRTLNSSARDFNEFGSLSFDYLLNKHPDFAKQLPAALPGINAAHKNRFSPLLILSSLAINTLALKSAEFIAGTFSNIPWPDIIYDYILWGNLAYSYKHRKKR
jgi:glycosyltransferase involved in cell wall biosynthesis